MRKMASFDMPSRYGLWRPRWKTLGLHTLAKPTYYNTRNDDQMLVRFWMVFVVTRATTTADAAAATKNKDTVWERNGICFFAGKAKTKR